MYVAAERLELTVLCCVEMRGCCVECCVCGLLCLCGVLCLCLFTYLLQCLIKHITCPLDVLMGKPSEINVREFLMWLMSFLARRQNQNDTSC